MKVVVMMWKVYCKMTSHRVLAHQTVGSRGRLALRLCVLASFAVLLGAIIPQV
jgi:hypothetical protein